MKAITREEKIMSGENLTPITRKEMFLAKAAGQNVKTPTPITREEIFLSKISGGGGSDFPVVEFFERTVTELKLDGVTALYTNAILNQNSLESIDLPDVIEIDAQAFNGCSNLSTVVLYEGLRIIAGSAFQVCPKITSIEIPSTVETIGWQAFIGCTNLETVTFLGKPTTMGSQFTSTIFPTSVKTINVPWSEGEVAGSPWGATSTTINYNYKGD